MISLRTEFHMPSSIIALVVTIKVKDKLIIRTAEMLFYVLQK
jgi:hypothetical protein